MSLKKPPKPEHKAAIANGQLHPRNRHQGRYDFVRLLQADPNLSAFLAINEHDEQAIDFADPDAVKALNCALLKDWYGIVGWHIPENSLCPPVRGGQIIYIIWPIFWQSRIKLVFQKRRACRCWTLAPAQVAFIPC